MRVPNERDARIAQLESRLRAKAAPLLRAPVALVCVLGALYLLWGQIPEVRYALSRGVPLTLGREGDYRWELLASGRYVQLHGTPTATAFWGRDRQGTFLVVGLQDTPLLVRRAPQSGETWVAGRPPPAPLQTPFALRGRLLSEEDAPAYRQAFVRARNLPGVLPREGRLWLVVEGERPGEDRGALVVAALLAVFAAFNGWLAVRSLFAGARRQRAGQA
jgi:hypothetical protein